ncbi:MAG: molecular chaperone DnaJ [Spirochaetia bacterium]|nr:molecular chaperone DnaJ [Spirochaetia bacterium]
MSKDLYDLLGVSKTASQDEIKSAFRNMAKKYHPDVHQGEDKKGAEEKFKEIAEAYSILGDPEQRQKYDSVGYDGMKGQGGFGGAGYRPMDMEDILGDMFGGMFGDMFGFDTGRGTRGGAGGRRRSGEDIRYDTTLTYEEVTFGKKETIEVTRKETCNTCKGDGLKPGTSKKTCTACGGTGKVRQSSGFFSVVTTCPRCRGAGQITEANCPECGGTGVKNRRRQIDVKIPAGVEAGSYLKLSGEGSTGQNGGHNGDLYVVINIKDHEIYSRDHDNVLLTLPITVTQAVLGDELEIPTLYGNHKLRIPEGSQSGDVLEIRGKGFPVLNHDSKGSMMVTLEVEIPRGMNSKLKEAFKNVKVLESDENYGAVKRAEKLFKKYKK